MENQLLHAPIQYFGDIELVFRRAGHLVNPTELLKLLAGLAEHSKNLAIESQFVNAARIRVSAVKHLPRSRRYTDRPRRSWRLCAFNVFRRLIADGSPRGVAIERHVDLEFPQNSTVAAIADVDIPLGIGRDRMRCVELTRLVAALAPGLQPIAVLVDFSDARVDVAIADVGISGRVPSDIGGLAETAVVVF